MLLNLESYKIEKLVSKVTLMASSRAYAPPMRSYLGRWSRRWCHERHLILFSRSCSFLNSKHIRHNIHPSCLVTNWPRWCWLMISVQTQWLCICISYNASLLQPVRALSQRPVMSYDVVCGIRNGHLLCRACKHRLNLLRILRPILWARHTLGSLGYYCFYNFFIA